jgi:hypothetical protein
VIAPSFRASKAGMQPILQTKSVHPDELIKSNLLSEIFLAGEGVAVAVSSLIVMVASLGSWLFQP